MLATSAPPQSLLRFVSLLPLIETSNLLPFLATPAIQLREAADYSGCTWHPLWRLRYAGVAGVYPYAIACTAAQSLWQKQWCPPITLTKSVFMNSFKKGIMLTLQFLRLWWQENEEEIEDKTMIRIEEIGKCGTFHMFAHFLSYHWYRTQHHTSRPWLASPRLSA